ncbi:hypothetical protein MRX96_027168 [Rhipicephalus microplus]
MTDGPPLFQDACRSWLHKHVSSIDVSMIVPAGAQQAKRLDGGGTLSRVWPPTSSSVFSAGRGRGPLPYINANDEKRSETDGMRREEAFQRNRYVLLES